MLSLLKKTRSVRRFVEDRRISREELFALERDLEEALAEDHRENADMFDIHAHGFSDKKHPNKTMRRLEARLADGDADFLCLLSALLELGMEILCGESFDSPAAFLRAAAQVYEAQQARFAGAAYLAADLTTPKAEHQLRRLQKSLAQLEAPQ
jgi:hypothetical protein